MEVGDPVVLARLVVAVVLGAAVGFEREAASRGAGLRTHALVALGAALFTMAGAYGFDDLPRSGDADPSRVAAQVAAGVGFIGAGAIIRHGTAVIGVTTAATVWLAAAVGVAAAAGFFGPAVVSTGLALLVLVYLRTAHGPARRFRRRSTLLEVEYSRGYGTLGPLLRGLVELEARVESLAIADEEEDETDGLRRVVMHLVGPRVDLIERLVDEFASRPEVRAIRLR